MQLKEAFVSPLYKGETGVNLKYADRWPSHLTRIRIGKYMENHYLHSDQQHDFRKGRSCLSKLLAHSGWVLHILIEGKNINVIFLDFVIAFDKVEYGILLHSIKDLGIAWKLAVWLHDFLTGRWRFVTVDGSRSEEAEVISGLPQGSVLGSLLLLIHMRDISKGVNYSSHPLLTPPR